MLPTETESRAVTESDSQELYTPPYSKWQCVCVVLLVIQTLLAMCMALQPDVNLEGAFQGAVFWESIGTATNMVFCTLIALNRSKWNLFYLPLLGLIICNCFKFDLKYEAVVLSLQLATTKILFWLPLRALGLSLIEKASGYPEEWQWKTVVNRWQFCLRDCFVASLMMALCLIFIIWTNPDENAPVRWSRYIYLTLIVLPVFAGLGHFPRAVQIGYWIMSGIVTFAVLELFQFFYFTKFHWGLNHPLEIKISSYLTILFFGNLFWQLTAYWLLRQLGYRIGFRKLESPTESATNSTTPTEQSTWLQN